MSSPLNASPEVATHVGMVRICCKRVWIVVIVFLVITVLTKTHGVNDHRTQNLSCVITRCKERFFSFYWASQAFCFLFPQTLAYKLTPTPTQVLTRFIVPLKTLGPLTWTAVRPEVSIGTPQFTFQSSSRAIGRKIERTFVHSSLPLMYQETEQTEWICKKIMAIPW